MLKEILLALSLISLSSSVTYSPWHLRNFDYSVSDICSYSDGTFQYVKPCQANFMCQTVGGDSHSIKTCRQVYKTVKIYGEVCSGNIECDSGLECEGSICINTNDGDVYEIKDRISNDNVYYCNTNRKPSVSSGSVVCTQNTDSIFTDMDGFCYKSGTDGSNPRTIPPAFNKVCGENSLVKYSSTNDYYISQTSMNSIGSLADGTYVSDERACQSGFALYLYRNKNLVKPATTEDQKMYLVCVTLKEIASDNEGKRVFKYSIGDTDYVYDVTKLPLRAEGGTYNYPTDSHLMTKLEIFKEFVNKAKGVTCQENKGYDNEQFTCKNDELRRLWYFYHNPGNYLLYKNQDAIVDYLIEQKYPEYSPRYAEPQQEASSYLSVKFISLLILLLSL